MPRSCQHQSKVSIVITVRGILALLKQPDAMVPTWVRQTSLWQAHALVAAVTPVPTLCIPLCGARQLTRALLADQYGIGGWWVPDAHLIPPVTNRANYIRWLAHLLALCPGEGLHT